MSDIQKLYTRFKSICDDAPEFFRQKDQYSQKEQLDFLCELYRCHGQLLLIFESDEALKKGEYVTIASNEFIDKTKLTRKLLDNEYDICVSVIFFNLSKQDICDIQDYAKSAHRPQDSLVVGKIFEKFND